MKTIITSIILLSSIASFAGNDLKALNTKTLEPLNLFPFELEFKEAEVDKLISNYRILNNFNIDSIETELEEELEEMENFNQ